jgi:hypothetical protein
MLPALSNMERLHLYKRTWHCSRPGLRLRTTLLCAAAAADPLQRLQGYPGGGQSFALVDHRSAGWAGVISLTGALFLAAMAIGLNLNKWAA